MRRWRLDLGYDGTGFSGWARQPGRRTVQGELALGLARVLRLATEPELVCAGRTDAGVHARGQVAHVDLPEWPEVDPPALVRRLGRALAPDLVVRRVTPAPAGFDARFSAVWRRYVYRLWDAAYPPDPLLRGTVTALRRPVDADQLVVAAAPLLGLRDFAPFCRRREGATTVRTLLRCDAARVVAEPGAGTVEVTVVADAFCHSMVRSLVGALVAVADGRHPSQWLAEVAASPARASGVQVMPPGGLTLEEVGYPGEDRLAERAAAARTMRSLP